jgi:arylsulfatase A-like enzyme
VDGKKPHAKNIIYLMMQGAMSHLDTFDPKPGRDEQGETKTIPTKTPGIVFGQSLEKLAGLSDRLAVVRSLTTETGAHEQGQYLMRTSYPMINSIRHPAFGSWAVHAMGKISKDLPSYVLVGNGNDHPGAGFLDPSLTPVPVADPTKGLENTVRPRYLSEKNFDRRLALADRIDRDFKQRYAGQQLDAYNQLYKDAVRLMGSVDLQAFDIAQEKPEVRDRYGDSKIGLGCLLARRLVESGVRCVEVEFGSWDMHRDVFEEMDEKGPQLDRAMAALLEDLEQRGLLASTLVVLATEFGRTPRINENAGRDHHPGVFSCVLAGAGVQGGAVYGQSDERGFRPDKDPVSVADFNTTIAAACGLPYEKEFHAPNGRPFKIGGGGKPISAVLA